MLQWNAGVVGMRRSNMRRHWASCIVLPLASASLTAACATLATPGPVSHSPFDLPNETGTVGRYLRDCLSPGTGLTLGSDARQSINPVQVTAVIRCEPDPGIDAVKVSRATRDIGPLLAAFTMRTTSSPAPTGKVTVFIVYLNDTTATYLAVTGIPETVVAQAGFTAIGTTPSGSL